MNIRRATLSEVKELQQISRETFYDTFSAANSKEDMEKYLRERLSLEVLSAELENSNSEFYFAEQDNKIIGYLKVNFGDAQTEKQEANALEIERIYVLKDFHGKHVGQLLYQKALGIAKEKNVAYVWLGVWEENHRAVAFYKKNGFTVFDKHTFTLGNDEQIDLMMKRQLT